MIPVLSSWVFAFPWTQPAVPFFVLSLVQSYRSTVLYLIVSIISIICLFPPTHFWSLSVSDSQSVSQWKLWELPRLSVSLRLCGNKQIIKADTLSLFPVLYIDSSPPIPGQVNLTHHHHHHHHHNTYIRHTLALESFEFIIATCLTTRPSTTSILNLLNRHSYQSSFVN